MNSSIELVKMLKNAPEWIINIFQTFAIGVIAGLVILVEIGDVAFANYADGLNLVTKLIQIQTTYVITISCYIFGIIIVRISDSMLFNIRYTLGDLNRWKREVFILLTASNIKQRNEAAPVDSNKFDILNAELIENAVFGFKGIQKKAYSLTNQMSITLYSLDELLKKSKNCSRAATFVASLWLLSWGHYIFSIIYLLKNFSYLNIMLIVMFYYVTKLISTIHAQLVNQSKQFFLLAYLKETEKSENN